jgi:hypothetical protein
MLDPMAESRGTDDPVASNGTLHEGNKDAPANAGGEDLTGCGQATGGEAGADSMRRPSSIALLADLERRVRRLEARVDGLEASGSSSRPLVKASDMARWGLWLVVIAFLVYYWLRMGAPR